jgi:hypothetical protein
MTTISSASTWFHKRLFPAAWFGFLTLFVVMTTIEGAAEANLGFILVPVVMAGFGFIIMKMLVWDLADQVADGGDYLVVRNRGEEDRIPLSNIINVSASTLTNPPRVTLRLAEAGKFGKEITFSPIRPFSLNPFAKNPIVEDLIIRVDQARSKRR